MKPLAPLVLLAFVHPANTPTAQVQYFQYQRTIGRTINRPISNATAAGQTCVVLDPEVFEHAAPELADLRLYRSLNGGKIETPYILRVSTPSETTEKPLTPLNLGLRGKDTVFDAAMPAGNYSDLDLSIVGQDFIETVHVTGSNSEARASETRLGSFTIFDLTGQKLGRSTILHLPSSDFPYLHFRIVGPLAPEQVSGLTIEPTPATRPRYATIVESSEVRQDGRTSVVEFTVPAHVPVDHVTFVPPAQPVSFSRAVTVAATPSASQPSADPVEAPQPSIFSGTLLRVHTEREGHTLDEERLTLDVPQTSFETAAKWTVRIDNGDDVALVPQAVRLEMLERTLCYEAMAGTTDTLYYSDPVLGPPRYDYGTLFVARADAAALILGPEQANAAYQARPDARPFTERHPALLWVVLIAAIVFLGVLALGSVKRSQRV